MDQPVDADWKKTVGFPINYSSGSSDDDFDCKDVVFRNPRQSAALLADCGDGTEADMLGTTPPRSRIRKKEMQRRNYSDTPLVQRVPKKDVVDNPSADSNTPVSDRLLLKKRSSLKQIRTWQRDSKQDLGLEVRCDSMPSSNPIQALPTLVETCSRFMSLSSRPKQREADAPPEHVRWRSGAHDQLPASRVNFHRTFSLLINMGNVDKGCKRTMNAGAQISKEEQVWQNELKDLIWLELQAALAGRALAQQDAFLCAQRDAVPALLRSILAYRFVNTQPCTQARLNGGRTSNDQDSEIFEDALGCLAVDCQQCAAAIGAAVREVGALLDAFHGAAALFPSSRAMTLQHPQLAEAPFNDRIKAMCLWYNTALHMRLKMLAVLRMLSSIKLKRLSGSSHRASMDSVISRQSSEDYRTSRVRFNVTQNPTDSNNSDSSGHSGLSETIKEADEAKDSDTVDEGAKEAEGGRADEVDSGCDTASSRPAGLATPEIVVSEQDGALCWEGEALPPPPGHSADAFDAAALAELSQIRLLNKCNVSLYRDYHREMLKTQGVRRCMTFVNKMRTQLLDKVLLTLERPDSETYADDEPAEGLDEPKDEDDKDEFASDEEEIKRYGCWSEECVAMRLPSYRPHFLLLSSICMEAVHDYLSFRIETRPDRPSCLTVKQLIHELREGLDISTEMRAAFVRYARAALAGAEGRAAQAQRLLDTFDATVQTLFEQYLSYLTTMSETEGMARSSLQSEWAFTARLAARIRCAAELAPVAFSNITCNQLNRLLKQFDEEFGKLQVDENEKDPDKEAIYAVCRSVQSIYAWSRDTALQTVQWATALAARLARAPPPAYEAQRAEMFDCIMAIRDFIMKHIILVLDKSKNSPNEDLPRDLVETLSMRVRELLLQIYKLGFELHKELYKFVHGARLSEESSLRRGRPASLQPSRTPVVERRKRPETMLVHESFNPMIHKELHRFVHESDVRRLVAPSGSPPRRPKFLRTDSIVDDYEKNVFDEKLFDTNLLPGQSCEARPERAEGAAGAGGAAGAAQQQWAGRVARAVISFAQCWMRFVVQRCDRGRGLRPRWASQGLDFLMLACDPCNTKYLSDEEFEELKQLMDGCISHVVGSRPAQPAQPSPHSPRPRPKLPKSPMPGGREPQSPASPPPEPCEPDALLSYPETESVAHRRRVLEAIARVDAARDRRLRRCAAVGAVLGAAASFEPRLRQLSFKWQRGLKIGAGTFGKVYTVVNTESGQLLAMKELAVAADDRRALQRAANELHVLEGVVHPHLVRYYGCELHRDKMLIFMELCVEGSLEALVATAGALAEPAVRRYCKQLLSAVAALHARAIAHRDIKSGNIFLTNEGHCLKLGDFGSAVKMRANATAPGELQGYVGTHAYMAPELFLKTSGYGRAADIWSLGCVVTEMASGKRPFWQYDSSGQIIYAVGTGGRPEVPSSLSAEGQTFCRACLAHDPAERPRAAALALHHFLMVKSDDDCPCEPAYLIT